MRRHPVVAVVAVTWSVVVTTGAGCQQAGRAQPAANVVALDDASTAVRLQATFYELRIAPDQVAGLDAARLAATDLAKGPPELGKSRVLYLVDQQVSLAGDEVFVGTQEPIVTNSRVTGSGQTVNSVEYREVGAMIKFKADRIGPRQLHVTSTMEMSTLTDSPVEAARGAGTAVTRRSAMSLKGPVELGKPTVLISGDASSRDKEGNAVVYVARLVLGGASPAAK